AEGHPGSQAPGRYVGGAHVAALGERGEPADVYSDQPGKRLGLSVTEHRELSGQLLDGTVALA
ncbi:hypothetical protein SB748_37165, partial [Rhizobium sp. SIMBA_035]